jgi:Flp pilus assembly protein TadD
MLALLMGRHEKSYEAGLTTLRSLLPELDPEDVSRRLAEGQLADDWGNSGPVVAILEKASSQPGWLDGRELTEGVWRVHHGESEQGLRLLETALLHSPEDPDRLNAFGFTLVEQGKNTREAEILLRRAYRLDSEAGFVLDSLGWLFFRQGRLDEAALWLGRALRLRPDDPEVIYHMGRLHGATGDELEAQRSYEQALELHPAQALVRQIREQLGRSMP